MYDEITIKQELVSVIDDFKELERIDKNNLSNVKNIFNLSLDMYNILKWKELSIDEIAVERYSKLVSEWYEKNFDKLTALNLSDNELRLHTKNRMIVKNIYDFLSTAETQYSNTVKSRTSNDLKTYDFISAFANPTATESSEQISPSNKTAGRSETSKPSIFIVHGRDAELKSEVAEFLEKIEINPIILHEQSSGTENAIEKIDQLSDTVGFGIVLYTPCDKGTLNEEPSDFKYRARQNVVFEHGYLLSKLGHKNVAALVKGDIELPDNSSGAVYINCSGDWKMRLIKELMKSGYEIDTNLLFK